MAGERERRPNLTRRQLVTGSIAVGGVAVFGDGVRNVISAGFRDLRQNKEAGRRLKEPEITPQDIAEIERRAEAIEERQKKLPPRIKQQIDEEQAKKLSVFVRGD
jgi:hypothetical protein